MNFMGLDIGTTGCKVLVLSQQGNVLGTGFREYTVHSLSASTHEQDAEHVWMLTLQAMQEALRKSGVDSLQAISYSVQGDAVIAVDQKGKALSPAILGMDYRSAQETETCAQLCGAHALFEQTGMRPHPMNSATKILWIQKNQPETYEKAYKLVTYADFLLGKLGADAIDETMASRTMLYDLHKKEWSSQLLDKFGLDAEKLSEVVPSGTVVGQLREELRQLFGLTGTTILVAGGHDQTCAALGSGIIHEGIALDSHGTAEVLSTAFYSPKLEESMFSSYYPCYSHVKANMYFTFSLNHVGGILLKWFRDEFCEKQAEEAGMLGCSTFQLLESRAPEGPSSVMILPHFNGSGTPWCDLQAKGAIVGLTLSTTKYDLVQAIMESLTYELLLNLQQFEACGIAVETLRAVGGAAKSEKWMQIKADITGKIVQTLETGDAAALGAAMLAGTACGVFSDLEKAVEVCVHTQKNYVPDPVRAAKYREKFDVYRTIYPMLKDLNCRL